MATKTVIETHEMYGGKIKLLYYPTSHKYKLDGEELYGVSKTPDIIDKPGLRFYYMFEAIKGMQRELNPDNKESFTLTISQKEWSSLYGRHKMDFRKKNTRGTDTGTLAHDWLEKFFTAMKDSKPLPTIPDRKPATALPKVHTYEQYDIWESENEWNNLVDALEEFTSWISNQEVEVVELEKLVLSVQYKFAGRFDAILKINGKLYLVDFKTNNPSADYPDGIFPTMFDQIGGYDIAYTEEHYPELHAKNKSCFDGHVVFNFNKKTGRFKRRFTKDNEVALNRNWFIHTLATKRGDKYYEFTLKEEHKERRKK